MRISPVILIDIGNTSTSAALESAGRFVCVKRIPSHGQTTRKVRRFLEFFARRRNIAGAALCSVAPCLDKIWQKELKNIVSGKILRVSHKMNLGIKIKYPDPASIGADRLANAVGACGKYGAPVIVADFGTALTFDFVTADRAYAGGIIIPGPEVFGQCLAGRTALLPHLSAEKICKVFQQKKEKLIGKNTEEAMLIGIRLGYLGLVRDAFARIMRYRRAKGAKLCATGGYADLVLKTAGLKISMDPLLTLRGINRIYWLNI